MKESEQTLHESLSAAIDGEAEELELRRVVNAVTEDPELQAKWQRMHVLGSVLRQEPLTTAGSAPPNWPAQTDRDSADHAAVASVPASEGKPPARSLRARWLAPLGSAVLAAAAGLVVALYFGPDEPSEAAPALADRPEPPAHGLANVPTAVDLERANAYIYQHARGTSIAARPATMPFVKELSSPPVQRPGTGTATSRPER